MTITSQSPGTPMTVETKNDGVVDVTAKAEALADSVALTRRVTLSHTSDNAEV